MESLMGTPVAKGLLERVERGCKLLEPSGVTARLVCVMVGTSKMAEAYFKSLQRSFSKFPLELSLCRMEDVADQRAFNRQLDCLSEDPQVSAIMVLTPLPRHLSLVEAASHIAPAKDVDAITLENRAVLYAGEDPLFVPATAGACMEILDHYGISPECKDVVVVGRSLTVGKPVAQLLLKRNATVTVCHSKTQDLPSQLSHADILVLATGHAHLVHGDKIRSGAIILDAGMSYVEGRGMTGDAYEPSFQGRRCALTPVPGGVGPVTVAYQAWQVVKACLLAQNLPEDLAGEHR